MCLIEKAHIFNKLYSDMSYRTTDHEFNANESKIYVLNKMSSYRLKQSYVVTFHVDENVAMRITGL
jgi:hypothetical protein